MQIPYVPVIFGKTINVHLVLEYLAFFVAFRYYVYAKKGVEDPISKENRLSIILGAMIGALVGSRLMGYLENPIPFSEPAHFLLLMNVKTIMGGLFGALISVEITKKYIGEPHSSGDLFTFPTMLGIFIGRIGCFLTGINEFTYGTTTHFFMGMDLGDGQLRHPLALYELLFLPLLYLALRWVAHTRSLINGELYILFMLSYFGFRFFMEFLKPNDFIPFGLSSIQWLCIGCYLYYYKRIIKFIAYAR
jgi:phosphatidylglycerol---prolipoprotein diacylglyceryl transferase